MAEIREAAADPGLYAAQRLGETRGDLGVGKGGEQGELEGVTLRRGEGGQDAAYPGGSFVPLSGAARVLAESELRVTKTTQVSRSQNDRRDTQGDFVLAWLDHGAAPRDAGYAYAILVGPGEVRRRKFTSAIESPTEAPFTIHRRDHAAHIVSDRATGILAAAFFEPVAFTGLEIAGVDTPSLVMLHTSGDRAELSVCDPDLHLYSGKEPDQLLPDGRQREVSIYSRSWFQSASQASQVTVTLDGDFALGRPDSRARIAAAGSGTTRIEFTCTDGLPVEIELVRRSAPRASNTIP